MIKHVKSFGAELQVHALGELRVFNYGQVSVDEFGSRQDIPSEITEMIARGRGPHRQSKGGARCRGTQGLRYTRLRRLGAYHRIAEPLCGIPGDGYRRQEVGPQSAAYPQRNGAGKVDRKSTRLNSSHTVISYAVFCLKKKKKNR